MSNLAIYLFVIQLILSLDAAPQVLDQLQNGLDYYSYEGLEDETEKVSIKIYYECLCPDCRRFDSEQLVPVMRRLTDHLDIQTFPYGNAKTEEHDGKPTFTCQHGPAECYGNKLHACALDLLRNHTQALLVNACMMDPSQAGRGSDDQALDVCGKAMGFDTAPIKHCATSDRGTQLLEHYGEESGKVGYDYVPYVLINNKVLDPDCSDLLKFVCDAFVAPPRECRAYARELLEHGGSGGGGYARYAGCAS